MEPSLTTPPSDRALYAQLHAHEPASVMAGLQALQQALSAAPPARQAALACLLPADARQLPRDLHLPLLALHRSLGAQRLAPARLRWRDAGLPLHLQAWWLATELALCPERLLGEPVDERLLAALDHLHGEPLPAPGRLLRALVVRRHPLLAFRGERHLLRQLQDHQLLPSEAAPLLVALTLQVAPHNLDSLLGSWSSPWFVLSGAWQPGPLLRALGFRETARAAIRAACALGQAALLRRALSVDLLPDDLASAAVGLGRLGEREDIPLLLAAPSAGTLEALLQLRHRGRYLQAEQLSALLEHVPAQHAPDPALAGQILALTGHLPVPLLATLGALSPDDGRWGVLAEVAAALPDGDALLTRVAEETATWTLRRAALSASRDEALLLRWLEAEPDVCLPRLQRVGGAATRQRLHPILCEEGAISTVSAMLLAHHRDMVALLWRLTPAEERAALLAHLDPHDLPPGVIDSLGASPSVAEQAFLLRVPGGSPALGRVLERLCVVGDAATVPTVLDLLRSHIVALVEGSTQEAGAAVAREARPELSARLLAALDGLGQRLWPAGDEGRRRVVGWLLDIAGSLDRQGASSVVRLVLAALAARPVPAHAPTVRAWLRHPDRLVRAQAVRTLADWRDLASGHLLVLLAGEAEDIETRRAAIEAVGALRLSAGADALIATLEHPNMNLKRCAARALARLRPPQATPRLLFWLGYHDNAGFREDLRAALQAIHGEDLPAVLLEATLAARDARTRALLAQEAPTPARHQQRLAAPTAAPEAPPPAWDPAAARAHLDAGEDTAARTLARTHPQAWCALVDALEPGVQRAQALAVLLRSGVPGLAALLRARVVWLLDIQGAAGPGNPAEAALLQEILPALPLSPTEAIAAAAHLRGTPAADGAAWLALLLRWGADVQPADLQAALQHLRHHPRAQAERERLLSVWLPTLPDRTRTALARDPSGVAALLSRLPLRARWHALSGDREDAADWARAEARRRTPPPPPLSLAAYLQQPEASLPDAPPARLAWALADHPESADETPDPARVARLLGPLPAAARLRLVPWLLRADLEPAAVKAILRALPPDTLVPILAAHGDPQWMDVLAGRGPLQPVSALAQIQAVVSEALWARLEVRTSPATRRAALAQQVAAWQEPRTPRSGGPRLPPEASRAEHLAILRAQKEPAKIRVALRALGQDRSPEVVEAAAALLDHPDGRLRSAAHRCLRGCAPPERYLAETLRLLQADPRLEVQRAAIKTLAHRKYLPAVRPLVRLLLEREPKVQQAAAEGLCLLGEAALGELHQARRSARPDHRAVYEDLIARITQAQAEGSGC